MDACRAINELVFALIFIAAVGLGLAICRSIVRLHGGRVWAEKMPGGGSAFRFVLPIEAAPQPPAESSTT